MCQHVQDAMNNPLIKKTTYGAEEVLTDVCPFTVFGLFNKGITNQNRKLIEVRLDVLNFYINILETEFSYEKKHRDN